jgi:hypothetical protein
LRGGGVMPPSLFSFRGGNMEYALKLLALILIALLILALVFFVGWPILVSWFSTVYTFWFGVG